MATLSKRRKQWFATISEGSGAIRRRTHIPLRTESKVSARQRLSAVTSIEPDIKSGVIGSDTKSLEAYFPWMNEEGTSKVVQLGLEDAVSEWLD